MCYLFFQFSKSMSFLCLVCLFSMNANGLQAGTVCSLKKCLPKCLFKDTNVCCFCKNEKTCLPEILQKLLPRPRKLCLLAVTSWHLLFLTTTSRARQLEVFYKLHLSMCHFFSLLKSICYRFLTKNMCH